MIQMRHLSWYIPRRPFTNEGENHPSRVCGFCQRVQWVQPSGAALAFWIWLTKAYHHGFPSVNINKVHKNKQCRQTCMSERLYYHIGGWFTLCGFGSMEIGRIRSSWAPSNLGSGENCISPEDAFHGIKRNLPGTGFLPESWGSWAHWQQPALVVPGVAAPQEPGHHIG